ncbi:putative transposase for insertion sequence element (plasmid) [Acidiphilium multivorum AIU301]|uniref:Putative transposase for insertion sequence element n=1 Tax=Acidiphilium multivorum (strain DSM 11245 / JCM 8867 / NBRC 100883 / AIU 301) TaxID=926570 RepID=F0J758_ACIMA|nr:IS110 family transposase [Acidiphilium multivorum]BAJ82925.1 putative transposase for insertion sequence element [Acidiphilium multivorum AIU301]GAN75722.1 transposase [Acidiphilium multivorum AIU301]
MPRVIGLDIHRDFAQAVALDGGNYTQMGRVQLDRDSLTAFGRRLLPSDEIVLEATANTFAVVRVLRPMVGKIVVANPLQVRLIADAKIKTDKIDAGVLAQLQATGFLPQVWIPDQETEILRRKFSRRSQLVRHRTRLKNEVHAILHSNLIVQCPFSDLFTATGKKWLGTQNLPEGDREAVERGFRELDRLAADLAALDRDLATQAVNDVRLQRMITITGIDMVSGLGLLAVIGDHKRFESSEKLVSYFGLNPSVRQSGNGPARHGRITKRGANLARSLLVEAAWAASRAPGPLRSFFMRVMARRGSQIAAVATARKLAVIIWHVLHREEEYVFARPSLVGRKRRAVELRAGRPQQRGRRGIAGRYHNPITRAEERARLEQSERAYERVVSGWQPTGPRKPGRSPRQGDDPK